MNWLFLLVTTFLFQVEIGAITHSTKDKDELNLNTIQNGHQDQHKMNKKDTNKDGIEDATQEKRTFFQPQADRKGSFYSSGPNFPVGTSINVGNTGYSPNYHTSGNGYSYGAPGSPEYPLLNNYPTGQPTGPNIAQGESSFSERNHNFGGATNFGHNYPSFGYGVPNSGHSGGSGYGVPSVGHSAGGSFGIASVGHSAGGGFGIPSVGHSSGGGFGIQPQHGGGAHHPLKGLLIPIAGFALLGAAAVLAKSHPVLLQLGVIHGRKRRSVYPVNPFTSPGK